ncbi:MAG: redox-regulated ATPase YchF [Candidatus Pacebacteria bacterium]|nr:redox-regulated ATPase YchF [Candidatus Paceibacterota bacterium]MDD2757024.1 redox-regulated ATPase YchF [Candidatus Paceibacterota bacterium]MDD3283533.1 redox-regulated ATPase YchF [Candidatus Paceibacterota bacterium]MDD3969610.1 redox-regulated ATPase YchF [Candidatus Paceibacterota bacterium]MDD4737844.1 redox-regulated ATPase YchF [Candidatus Paceibacterota bacterium]
MALQIGIVGFPNVGKSTLFQLITKKQVDIANYPFCTIDPNVGVTCVPDSRVGELANLTKSAKKIYATIEFVDIAGLVEGASKGEGLGNKFLANIRETDAIVYVLRCFKNDNVIKTRDDLDVLKDKEILDMEMILKDIETIEKRLSSLEKEIRANKKEAVKESEILKKVYELLKDGKIISDVSLSDEEKKIVDSYQLLSSKPRLYLLNGEQKDVSAEVLDYFKNKAHIFMDILTEVESGELSEDEQKELGIEPKLNELIKEAYRLLGLINFFTTGPDETRSWTIKSGSSAPQAGSAIHSDFEDKFIRAEVINWKDLIDCNGFARAREKGMIKTEGKEYIVKDGDVIEFKI